MRTSIDLREDQAVRLDELCRRDGLSRTEAVRRAVDAYLNARHASERDDVFGIWRGRNLESLGYERYLRNEWT